MPEIAINFFNRLRKRFGINRSIVVTTTSKVLYPPSRRRNKFIVKNDSPRDVWLSFSPVATAVDGEGNFKIAANGGYWEVEGYQGIISCITVGGNAKITAWEV